MPVDLTPLAAVLDGALIALDFDGTAADIVLDPALARPVPGLVEALTELARSGAQVAIVTGRDVATLLGLAPVADVPGLIISGLHGAESWRDGHRQTRAEPAGLAELRVSLPPLLAAVDPAIWLEDKRLSLVVHTRATADPDGNQARLSRPVRELAEAQGLEVTGGKSVLEIRIAGLSKADALNELLTPSTTGALFAGDDLGDVPALAAVRAWGERTGQPALTFAVGEVPEVRQAAAFSLPAPTALRDLLAELARSHRG
jgi:trehalose 6-phosphate phosphatase